MLYGIVATLTGVAVTVVLRRRSRAGASDLVRAEAAEWAGDTLLSAAVLVGFVVAAVLDRAGRADLARYVDPVMVAVVSAAFLPVPARLMATAFREVLTMAPPARLREPILAVVRAVQAEHGFEEASVRTSKVGGRLDVEIVFLVGADSTELTVRQCDTVRAQLDRRLAEPERFLSMSVAFTADPRWAQ